MRRTRRTKALLALAGLIALVVGCQSGGQRATILSLFGLSEPPIVIALLPEPGVLSPFPQHEPLRKALEETLQREVRLDLCLPFQLSPSLSLGIYDAALLTPTAYARAGDQKNLPILAVSVDQQGQVERPAVMIVRADSAITKVADLKGKRVAFGPRDDSRTHIAALALLSEHGLKESDLAFSLLPTPSNAVYLTDMDEIARQVAGGSIDAGFTDEASWASLPQIAEEGRPARDTFRVVARTAPVPDKLLIVSPKLKPGLRDRVVASFLDVGVAHPDVLYPLRFSGFCAPDDHVSENCAKIARAAGVIGPAPASKANN